MSMIDYNNPNDLWGPEYDPYKSMTDEEKLNAGCLKAGMIVLMILAGLVVCCLMGSCTTTKYVTVPQQHTEHHWHTDSVFQRDSVVKETLTTVMQLDSAEMSRYGIQLKSAERAWLVKTAELERQIQQLMQLSATRDTVRDSIPYPVEVPVEVPAQLTWWQQTRLHIATILLYLLGLGALFMCVKRYFKP